VAIWLNLTTALAFSGAPVSGTAGVVGQLAVLAGAVLGASGAGEPVLAAAAGAGLLVVLATTAVLRLVRPAAAGRR